MLCSNVNCGWAVYFFLISTLNMVLVNLTRIMEIYYRVRAKPHIKQKKQ